MAAAKPSIVRLLTLGDSGAGKSSLLLRYTQNDFTHEYMPTIGIDFRLKTVNVGGRTVKVQVWDTAGQERFRTITHNYYRGAHGIALVYDVTQQQSFNNIRKWVQDVHTYAEQSVNLVLIGNKVDLDAQRAVETKTARALAEEFDIHFFETSAKNNVNVDEAFTTLVEAVVERMFTPDGGNGGRDPTDERRDGGNNGGGGGLNGGLDIRESETDKKGCCS